jgi:hypothetical protein
VDSPALDDPDRLALAGEAPQRRPCDARRHVRLERGVQAVFTRIGSPVVLDDRTQVARPQLAPDLDLVHG